MNSVTISKVLYRNVTSPYKLVNADDFVCTPPVAITENQLTSLETVIPYAIDYRKKRNIYIAKCNPQNAIQSPFLYKYLRENAEYVVSVPWDTGTIHKSIKKFNSPIFIFSPGRSGSTLLSKITQAADCISFSEPDFYSQSAIIPRYAKNPELLKLNKKLLINLTADLLYAYGATSSSNTTIKLRAEACSKPEIFIFSPKQESIFLTRHFIPWAESVVWHFGKSNPKILNSLDIFYENSIKCLKFLLSNSACSILTYEDISNPSVNSSQKLSDAFHANISINLLNTVLMSDSQKGSGLESTQYNFSPSTTSAIQTAYEKWLKITDHKFLIKCGLDYLLNKDN